MNVYSNDLRQKILNYSLNNSIRETAKVFGVSPDTVYRIKKLFFETNSIIPRKPIREYTRLISEEGEMYLKRLISEKSDLTLEEIINDYAEKYGIRVSMGTMFNTLEKLNITYKKKSFSDPKKHTEKNEELKKEYDLKLAEIPTKNRFYLDETGTYLNLTPLYGRSKCGEPVYDEKPTHSSGTINTIAILSEDGILAPYSYTTTMTSSVFIEYLDIHVLPILTNGQTLIMDNLKVHHAKNVKAYLNEKGINVLYLPAYSPELNPIEEAFSKIKNYIKRKKAWTLNKLESVIKDAFNTITKDDARGYFNHAFQFSNL